MSLPIADKQLGQHFLKDRKVIETITSDFETKAHSIIEIGPGPAILTKELAKKNIPFYVIEKDKRFDHYLKDYLPEDHIVFDDALHFDLQSFIQKKQLSEVWLVSNLPYNISAPLFMKFLAIPEIKYLTLMFQKEVALKILPYADTKNSQSSLSLLSENYFHAKHLIKAAPGAFLPPPKVDSLVLSLERNQNPTVALTDLESFENFLRYIYRAKRKQLQSNLKDKQIRNLHEILATLNISPDIRAEAMTSHSIIALYQILKDSF